MGGEASRGHPFKLRKSGSGDKSQPHDASNLPEDTEDWTEVAVVSWNDWLLGAAESMGFDLFNSWFSLNLRVHKKPWSKFSVICKQPPGRLDKHVCSFSCEVEETGREERVSWWIKNTSVIGMSSELMVVQVVVAKAVKILVVEWRADRLLGTYSFACPHEACLQECYITPDSSILLLRQNSQLRGAMGHITAYDPNIKVIKVEEGLCHRLYVIEDTFAYNFFGSGIAMNPLLPTGQVTVISSMYQPVENADQGIRVIDLASETVIQTAASPIDKVVHHCQYSPDGALIVVLCIDVSLAMWSAVLPENVHILKADTFDVVRILPVPYLSQRKPVFNDIKIRASPFFSRNGMLLGQFQLVGTSPNPDKVVVYKVPFRRTNLQDLCRRVILKFVPLNCLDKLPLPTRIQNYLNFR